MEGVVELQAEVGDLIVDAGEFPVLEDPWFDSEFKVV